MSFTQIGTPVLSISMGYEVAEVEDLTHGSITIRPDKVKVSITSSSVHIRFDVSGYRVLKGGVLSGTTRHTFSSYRLRGATPTGVAEVIADAGERAAGVLEAMYNA